MSREEKVEEVVSIKNASFFFFFFSSVGRDRGFDVEMVGFVWNVKA